MSLFGNIFSSPEKKGTLLIEAIMSGDRKKAQTLIKNGADPNAKDDLDSYTALHIAAEKDYPEIVQLLIEKGADLNPTMGNGDTPLHCAFHQSKREMVKLLIEKGADINAKGNGIWKRTALELALNKGYPEIVKLLIEKGADINTVFEGGWTPWRLALKNNYLEIVQLLIENGIDINVVIIDEGKTALHVAAICGELEQAQFLIAKGADINIKDRDGHTALYYAAEKGYPEIVQLLLIKKGDDKFTSKADQIYSNYQLGLAFYRKAQPRYQPNSLEFPSFNDEGLKRAKALFTSCLELDPNNIDALLIKAQCAYDEYNHADMSKSLLEITELVNLYPNIARAYDLLGSLRYATHGDGDEENKILETIAYNKKALEIDPNYKSNFGNRIALNGTSNNYYRSNIAGLEKQLAELHLKKESTKTQYSDNSGQVEPLKRFETITTRSVEVATTALCKDAITALPVLNEDLIKAHYLQVADKWASKQLYEGTPQEIFDLVSLSLDKLKNNNGFQSFTITTYPQDQCAQINIISNNSFQPIRLWRSNEKLFICGNSAFHR